MTDDPVPLSERAKNFAMEYCADFKVGAAAGRAGISHQHANNLLKDYRVQAIIREHKRKSTERVNISVDWVLEKLRRIADANTLDVFQFETVTADIFGPVTPHKELTGGLRLAEMTDEQKEAIKSVKWTKYGPAVEYHDKVAAVVHVAKYLGMFVDRHELSGPGGGPVPMINSTMSPKEAAELYAASINAGR